jgi:hypothetical protein
VSFHKSPYGRLHLRRRDRQISNRHKITSYAVYAAAVAGVLKIDPLPGVATSAKIEYDMQKGG